MLKNYKKEKWVMSENISKKDFNVKYKNYFRDFYVYQFKNKDSEFFGKTNFSRSRMIALIILSFVEKAISLDDLCNVKMKDIKITPEKVTIKIKDNYRDIKKTVEFLKPLSEMVRFLYNSESSSFFGTGHTGAPKKERIIAEQANFNKNCSSPKTIDKMYRYWSRVYLDEANDTIAKSTYDIDSKRIRKVIEGMTDVIWKNGRIVDSINGIVTDKDDNRVECITADARALKENPFHILYRYCNRYSEDDKNKRNDFFVIIYAMLLYFNLDGKVNYYNRKDISEKRSNDFVKYLEGLAAKEFNKKNGIESQKAWEELTPKQRHRYASKIPSIFMTNSFKRLICDKYNEKLKDEIRKEGEVEIKKAKNQKERLDAETKTQNSLGRYRYKSWENIKDDENISDFISECLESSCNSLSTEYLDVFAYLVLNRKELVYRNQEFKIVNASYLEKSLLYVALCKFIVHGERQFSNILKEIAKTGFIQEKKELILQGNRKVKLDLDANREKIIDLLSREPECLFILMESFESNSLKIQYDSKIAKEKVVKLKETLESVGLTVKYSDKIYYSVSNISIKDILGNDSDLITRFSEMISFFSQTSSLGEIGTYILSKLPCVNSPFRFKHNYIIKALNDYNIISLLYAIKNKKWVEMESRDAVNEQKYQHFTCKPLTIKENVSDGRQYLIFYHPMYRSISSMRIDSIDSIVVGERIEESYCFFDEKRAKKLIDYTWGLKFADFYEGNVKSDVYPSIVTVKINYNPQKEKYIKKRLQREIGEIEEIKNETDSLLKISANVVNPWDMIQWIKTYTTRIVHIDIQYNSFMNDIYRSSENYQFPARENVQFTLSEQNKSILETADSSFTPCEQIYDQIFNEIYCSDFLRCGEVLFDILNFSNQKNSLTLDLNNFDPQCINDSELSSKQTKNFVESFTYKSFGKFYPIFSFVEKGTTSNINEMVPMSNIEVQWLLNILEHPLSNAFLTEAEQKRIKNFLPQKGLFDVNNVELLDVHSEPFLASFYKSDNFNDYMKKILDAIRNNKKITIKNNDQYGKLSDPIKIAPAYIEYSKRDNKFRIRAISYSNPGISTHNIERLTALNNKEMNGCEFVSTYNIERLVGVIDSGEHFDRADVEERISNVDNEQKELIVCFNETESVHERILSEFSCYRKECVRFGNGKYKMSLFYNIDDSKEITVRLLGYGSLISVSGSAEDPVVADLKNRYKNQIDLFQIHNNMKENSVEGDYNEFTRN